MERVQVIKQDINQVKTDHKKVGGGTTKYLPRDIDLMDYIKSDAERR